LWDGVPAILKVGRSVCAGNQIYFAVCFLATILLSQFPAVLAYISKLVIDSLIYQGPRGHYAANPKGPLVFGGVYLILLVIQYVGNALLLDATETVTEKASKNIHLEIMRAGLRLEGLDYVDNPVFHDRRAVLEKNALYLPINAFRLATDLLSAAVTVLGMVALLFGLHPLIPVLILLFSAPELYTQKRSHRLLYEGVQETAGKERLRDYYSSVLLTEEYAKEVRVYDLGGYFIDKYRAVVENILDIIGPIRKRQVRYSVLSRMLASAGIIGPYLWTVAKALDGEISPGQLVMFMTAIVVIQQQVSRTAQTLAGHQDVFTMIRSLVSWIGVQPDIAPVGREQEAANGHGLPPQVRLDNVWFRYPGAEDYTLKGLTLEIRRGTSLAIVGNNGCGKTTLVKLLCRLYEQQQGTILYDGTDIRARSVQGVRDSLGVIFQDFRRYQLTVQENIALEELVCETQFEKVRQAAATANARRFVEDLPKEYETFLGKEFYEGVELSGGQWQRLALARAFYRDAGILILDEPTASLDVATEARIYADFKSMTQGRTALLISHRLSTVRIADCIAVVDGGRVVEQGDHDSLMSLGGMYSEMFALQANRYRL
jgi:ATP-binding cassette subfamily B protein